MTRGKQLFATLTIVSLFFAGATPALRAQADEKSSVLIVEVQTGSLASASEEYIELVNISNQIIDVSEWRLEYYSANPKSFDSPTRTIPLSGVLPPGEHYLIASSGYLVGSANDSFSAGLSGSGGHLFLVSNSPETTTTSDVHDVVGWGSAVKPETQSAKAPAAGKALTRKQDDQAAYIDTGNNAQDFDEQEPSPEGFIRPPVTDPEPDAPPEQDNEIENPQQPETDTTAETPQEEQEATVPLPSWPIDITELLPNPASPQTDAKDEFIELYNPGDVPVELTGYKLQTGTTYSHSYEFNDQIIQPKSYKAFYITETGVVLANSAGKARLLDANGQIISETTNYENAAEGQSWTWSGTKWEWSTTPTPNATNTITQKAAPVKAATPTTAQKKKSATKKSAAKPKSSKVSTAKATKGSTANGSGAGADADLNARAASIHPGILAGVGGLALSYGLYEYRRDILSGWQRFKQRFGR